MWNEVVHAHRYASRERSAAVYVSYQLPHNQAVNGLHRPTIEAAELGQV